jgi:glycosyltransferase involved in cell wall biosynthesis
LAGQFLDAPDKVEIIVDMVSKIVEGGLRVRGQGPTKNSTSGPLVSVITVVLNRESCLERAIRSVLKQTYGNIEYVIVDGGSNDGTLDVIRRFDMHIDYWISEPDEGMYDAMNKGIDLCLGEIIGILNSDDWYEPDAIERVVAAFEGNSSASLVCGAMRMWPSNEKPYRIKRPLNPLPVHCAMPFNHPTCFFREDVYARTGKFDSSFCTAADYDLILRFLRTGDSIVALDCVISNFRAGGTTTNNVYPPIRQLWSILRKNGFGALSALMGISYRLVRNIPSVIKIPCKRINRE